MHEGRMLLAAALIFGCAIVTNSPRILLFTLSLSVYILLCRIVWLGMMR